ncbi:DUF4920 domain-containing protein [Jejuia pallidilutea]|uniref:Branched-chain amino acid aminotransferase n=2 Tax=Jejuia pallidilutea TaxID=504487 RepID=A0A098LU88_9FLAO|nr:DUF4920 domain-containing protein [Jejuia pallidilutea]GAL89972.1 hypothetical protein JCM19538_2803 [Jejuia pallidilutea]
MRPVILLFICVLMLSSCKNKPNETNTEPVQRQEIAYAKFGKDIVPNDAVIAKSMAAHYIAMKEGDSIDSKMKAKVKKVCQAKGCWMTLDLGNDNEVMVKFKDYGFFVPKDIAGKEVVINGKAYVKEVSVDEQRHYAEDAGKSAEEIAAITLPKRTYSFEADGVLVAQ